MVIDTGKTRFTITAVVALVAVLTPPAASAKFGFARFGDAEPVTGINDPVAADGCPIESPDGLSLVIASRRGAGGDNDLWAADRPDTDTPFGPPTQLPAPINGDANDFCPTPTTGRELFFVSDRDAACAGGNIYLARQNIGDGGWSEPELLPCAPQGPNFDDAVFSPSLVETRRGTFLFYSSFGEIGDHDIYVSKLGPDGFGPGRRVDALSNPGDDDRMPNVRELFPGLYEVVYSSNRSTWGRRDWPAFGGQDVYRAITFSLPFRWSTPINLGPGVNTDGNETRATLSGDGERLYFGRGGDIFVSPRLR